MPNPTRETVEAFIDQLDPPLHPWQRALAVRWLTREQIQPAPKRLPSGGCSCGYSAGSRPTQIGCGGHQCPFRPINKFATDDVTGGARQDICPMCHNRTYIVYVSRDPERLLRWIEHDRRDGGLTSPTTEYAACEMSRSLYTPR